MMVDPGRYPHKEGVDSFKKSPDLTVGTRVSLTLLPILETLFLLLDSALSSLNLYLILLYCLLSCLTVVSGGLLFSKKGNGGKGDPGERDVGGSRKK